MPKKASAIMKAMANEILKPYEKGMLNMRGDELLEDCPEQDHFSCSYGEF